MIFLSVYPFFGLTSSYRLSLFTQITDIVFFGKGGYDFDTVYNMPIWLRNFTYSEIKKHYDEEAEAYSKAEKGQTLTKSNNPKVPDYVMKKPTKK